MIFSRRLKVAELAIKWCEEHSTKEYSVRQDAFGIVTALDALGFLKEADPNRKPYCTCGDTPCTCPF
jgi:hypothetical protein